jgi:hypothetical protein
VSRSLAVDQQEPHRLRTGHGPGRNGQSVVPQWRGGAGPPLPFSGARDIVREHARRRRPRGARAKPTIVVMGLHPQVNTEWRVERKGVPWFNG